MTKLNMFNYQIQNRIFITTFYEKALLQFGDAKEWENEKDLPIEMSENIDREISRFMQDNKIATVDFINRYDEDEFGRYIYFLRNNMKNRLDEYDMSGIEKFEHNLEKRNLSFYESIYLDRDTNLRCVKVSHTKGDYMTSMAAHLTDEQISNYFYVGLTLNIGTVGDDLVKVTKCEIFI